MSQPQFPFGRFQARARDSRWMWLLAGVVVLFCLLLRRDLPLNHDVAWLTVAAERMLAGGNYLDDFFEVNMPLAIVAYVPAVALANSLAISISTAVTVWVATLVLLSIAMSGHALQITQRGNISTQASALFAAWLVLILAIVPAYDLAQKEHLIALLMLPFLVAMGAMPSQLGWRLRVAIAMIAAAGCLLKPHFAGLPALLLMVRASAWGWGKSIWSVEALVLVSAAAMNITWVSMAHPDWFVVAEWAVDLYGYLESEEALRFVQADSFVPTLAATCALVVATCLSRGATRACLLGFATATIYAWLAFVLQGKGWRYQLLPATIFAMAWLPLWMFATSQSTRDVTCQRARLVATGLGAALVAMYAMQVNREAPRLSHLARSPIGEILSLLQPGDSVTVVSTSVTPFFPAATHLRLKWASRYSALWPLAALGGFQSDASPQQVVLRQRYETPFRQSIAEDLRRFQPDAVVVDLRHGQFGMPLGFDMLGYLLASPEFAEEWEAYELLGQSPEYAIYARKAEMTVHARRDDESAGGG
jgi:hypothetical protein